MRVLVTAGDEGWVDRAGTVVGSGGIVALPTETFYGLAVDPRQQQAVRRLLARKGYSPGRPLLLLAASRDQAAAIVPIPPGSEADLLASALWPGPLTLILPLRAGLALAACPGGSAALRVPAADIPRRLAAAAGTPITGTSANRAGAPPARRAEEVELSFGAGVDLVLDGGPTAGGLPSTLLDLTGACPLLRRAGAVPAEAITRLLGRPPALPGPG